MSDAYPNIDSNSVPTTSIYEVLPILSIAEAPSVTDASRTTAELETAPVPTIDCIPGMLVCVDYVNTCGGENYTKSE